MNPYLLSTCFEAVYGTMALEKLKSELLLNSRPVQG